MSPSLFGELLEDIMAIQNRDFPGALPVPRIMPFLTEAVLKLNGQRSEGIFRCVYTRAPPWRVSLT